MTPTPRTGPLARLLPSAAALAILATPLTAQNEFELLSTGPGGDALTRDSDEGTLSADGRWLAFVSRASELTGAGSNLNVYRKDMLTGVSVLVAQSDLGVEANGPNYHPRVSNTGLVVFPSRATSLDPLDGSMDEDIYLSNPDAGTIDVLGGALSGRTWGRPAITPDGRYIALATEHAHDPSDTDGLADIYVYDTLLDTYEAVSVTPSGTLSADFSSEAAISDDGRFVAFESEAADLVPGDTNGFDDVFVRDRLLGTTTRVSVASDGTQSDEESLEPAISADGRYVVFSSKALLAPMPFPGTAGVRLIYRHDLQTSETILISVDNSGRGPNEFCEEGTISDDGNLVTFGSYATNWWNGTLVEYDQIYVRDIAAGTTTMLSGATPGFALESESDTPSISRDGTSVVFSAELSLHPDDTNDDLDVYRTTTTPIMDWTYLGGELAGDARPLLSARGYFTAGADAMLDVRQAAPSASMGLVLGLARIDAPFKGGALIPSPDLLVFGTTDTDGAWVWPFVHPNNVAAGIELFVQAAVQDVGAPAGWALSNGVRGLSR